jgi:acetyltransferase
LRLSWAGLTPEQVQQLKPQLPPLATLSDLIDVSEDAGPEQYRAAIEAASQAPQIDGILVIYSPKTGVDGDAIATAIAGFNRQASKPLLACWMGDASVGEARRILSDAVIPSFEPRSGGGRFWQHRLFLPEPAVAAADAATLVRSGQA